MSPAPYNRPTLNLANLSFLRMSSFVLVSGNAEHFILQGKVAVLVGDADSG